MKIYLKIIICLASICLIIGVVLLITNKKDYLPGKYFGGISDGYLLVSDGKQYGYYDVKENKLKIEMKYDLPKNIKDFYITDFSILGSSTISFLKKENQKMLSSFNYKYGYIKTLKNGLYGLVDINENVILDSKYSELMVYDKDLILVCDNYFYFVNSKGEKLTDNNYTTVTQIDNNKLFVATKDDKYELLSSNLTNIFDKAYDLIAVFGSDNSYVIQVRDEDKDSYYLYNYSENKLEKLPIEASININNFVDSVITYQKGENQFYNYNVVSQKEVYLGNYSAVGNYVYDLAYAIDMDGKINYIDYDGNVVIPLNYETEDGYDFTKYGLAVVYGNDTAKIIDTNGKALSAGFENPYIVNEKLFIVGNYTLSLANENGKLISKEYKTIDIIENNEKYFIVSKETNNGERYGLINYKGKEIVPCKYLNVEVYDNYLLLRQKGNKSIIKKLN